jgi:RNA polymerase sigma-70 factor (family 1)
MSHSEKSTFEMSSIVDAIRDGDMAAFRQLYEAFHVQLYAFSLKFLKSPELSEEIVHDVFLKVWEKRAALDSSKNIQAYLFTICKNTILNTLEKAAHDTRLQQQIAHYLPTFDPEIDLETTDDSEMLWEAIRQLPTQRQQIFRLAKLEELSYEEIAQRMGITKGTVSDHLVKAMRSVRAYMYAKSGVVSVLLGWIWM